MSDKASLADALTAEIQRVTEKRERWLGYGREHPSMMVAPACAMMKIEIDEGISALASGDVARMMRAYSDLKDNDND